MAVSPRYSGKELDSGFQLDPQPERNPIDEIEISDYGSGRMDAGIG